MTFTVCSYPSFFISHHPLLHESWLMIFVAVIMPLLMCAGTRSRPSPASLFHWGPFFMEHEIVWGFGDHQHNCRHHEYVSLSRVLKGLRRFLYELELQMRFISSTKDTKGLFLFRTYQGKTISKRISSLSYMWKLVPLKKKKKKVWHCTFNLRRVERGWGVQLKEMWAVVSMPNRQVWQQNNTIVLQLEYKKKKAQKTLAAQMKVVQRLFLGETLIQSHPK